MAQQVPILVITGYSGSGKTTLIECLVVELAARGQRTGVVKHHRHPMVADARMRDSERFLASGAAAVGTIGTDSVALTWPSAGAPDLVKLSGLIEADLVLAEGFKSTTGPRLVVYGERPESVAELAPGRDVVAVVGEAPSPGWSWPSFRRDDIAGIADCVEAWLKGQRGGSRG